MGTVSIPNHAIAAPDLRGTRRIESYSKRNASEWSVFVLSIQFAIVQMLTAIAMALTEHAFTSCTKLCLHQLSTLYRQNNKRSQKTHQSKITNPLTYPDAIEVRQVSDNEFVGELLNQKDQGLDF